MSCIRRTSQSKSSSASLLQCKLAEFMQELEHNLLPAAFSTLRQQTPVETNNQVVATITVSGQMPLLSANTWTVN